MKAKKLAALLLAGIMVFSLVACGNSEQETVAPVPEAETPAPDPTPTPAPVATPEPRGEASIDFADGNYGFIAMYTTPVNADNSELSLVDWNGGKAVQVSNVDGQKSYIAIDIGSVLGNDIANLAGIDMTIGVSHEGGFSPVSGKYHAWVGSELDSSKTDPFSVYLATKNPNLGIASKIIDLFTVGTDNLLIMYLDTDLGPEQDNGFANFYIGDIRFFDSAGNTLKGDSAVAFNVPDGFVSSGGMDMNHYYLVDAVELPGFAVSAGGWSQAGIPIDDEIRALFVPGSIIEVAYSCPDEWAPLWLVGQGDSVGGWSRAVDEGNGYASVGTPAANGGSIQFSYEQLATVWGEGWETDLVVLEAEGCEAWEVYSVTVGMPNNFAKLGNVTELPGFAVSSGGWGQAGIEIDDAIRALFVPGSVIEVNYSCPDEWTPLWLVGQGDSVGGWSRAVDEGNGYATLGDVGGSGVIQFAYEDLAAFWGDGWETDLVKLEAEGCEAWEVFSVTVGNRFARATNMQELDGFAVSAGGWAQAGIDVNDDIRALFTPGMVMNVNYSCPGEWTPMWPVGQGDSVGGWSRAVHEDDGYRTVGIAAPGFVQFTYEQFVSIWGDGWETEMVKIEMEGCEPWEVYSVLVGRAK